MNSELENRFKGIVAITLNIPVSEVTHDAKLFDLASRDKNKLAAVAAAVLKGFQIAESEINTVFSESMTVRDSLDSIDAALVREGDKWSNPVYFTQYRRIKGPEQIVALNYLVKNTRTVENVAYVEHDVRFNGMAWAEKLNVGTDAPSIFCIEGTLDAYHSPEKLLPAYATVGYKTASGKNWNYRTYAYEDTPQKILISDVRQPREKILMKVGGTSQIFNTYDYCREQEFDLVDPVIPGML